MAYQPYLVLIVTSKTPENKSIVIILEETFQRDEVFLRTRKLFFTVEIYNLYCQIKNASLITKTMMLVNLFTISTFSYAVHAVSFHYPTQRAQIFQRDKLLPPRIFNPFGKLLQDCF